MRSVRGSHVTPTPPIGIPADACKPFVPSVRRGTHELSQIRFGVEADAMAVADQVLKCLASLLPNLCTRGWQDR